MCQTFFERARQYHVAELGAVGIERLDEGFSVDGDGVNALSVEFAVFKRAGVAASVLAAPCAFACGFAVFADIAVVGAARLLIGSQDGGRGGEGKHNGERQECEVFKHKVVHWI